MWRVQSAYDWCNRSWQEGHGLFLLQLSWTSAEGLPFKTYKKEMLEETIVSRVLEVLNDDEVVNWIADAVMETQKHENEKNRTAPAALKAELAEVNKSINGVMSAIEAGIITLTTKARLEELEAKAEQLKIDISDSELPVPDVDRDFIVYWLTKFRSGSLGDEEAQREFVDSLIFAVRVWNDRAEVVLNYSGDERTIDVLFGGAAETDGGSSKEQNSGAIRC